jgi:urease accessory protein
VSLAQLSAPHAPATWSAELDLVLARRGTATIIERRRHRGPLLVQRPFHPEADGTCHVYVLHPPGGIVGGDELTLNVDVRGGASALLTTPAATKLYRTKGPRATLRQNLGVEAGASLEWLPQETIAFGGSSVTSTTTVRLDRGSRYVGWEITCLGRPASKDDFSTGSFRHCTEIWRNDRLLLVDRTLVNASSMARQGAWGWAGRTVYATLFATTASEALVTELRARVVPERPGDLFAVTSISGITVCRWLGSSAEQARRALGFAWGFIRSELFGKPSCPPRIWST